MNRTKKVFMGALMSVIAAGTIALMTATPFAAAKPGNCSNVRCAACPDGYHLSLKWPNCCACLPNR